MCLQFYQLICSFVNQLIIIQHSLLVHVYQINTRNLISQILFHHAENIKRKLLLLQTVKLSRKMNYIQLSFVEILEFHYAIQLKNILQHHI